jgi:hypothetical protein
VRTVGQRQAKASDLGVWRTLAEEFLDVLQYSMRRRSRFLRRLLLYRLEELYFRNSEPVQPLHFRNSGQKRCEQGQEDLR